jgi:hypothetical protein
MRTLLGAVAVASRLAAGAAPPGDEAFCATQGAP